MMRWKVRKSPTGDWWAHEPGCNRYGDLVCMLLKSCQGTASFRSALAYAETKARIDWYSTPPKLFGRDFREENLKAIADEIAKGPIFKRSHNSL